PVAELIRAGAERAAIKIAIELLAEFFRLGRQFRRVLGELSDADPLQKIFRIVVMARQQGDAAEHALVEEIGLLGNKTNRIGIDQLGIDKRVEIHPEKGRVDERAFDRLDAEKNVLAGQRPSVLKASVSTDLECIGKFVLRYFGSRHGNE